MTTISTLLVLVLLLEFLGRSKGKDECTTFNLLLCCDLLTTMFRVRVDKQVISQMSEAVRVFFFRFVHTAANSACQY